MNSDRKTGITESEYNALLARVAARQATPPAAASARADKGRSAPAPEFSSLPGYRDLQIQRAAADVMGLDNPFFRVHERRAHAETQIGGRTYVNFASYDYLGFNGRREVAEAAKTAIDQYGVSASASRLVAGERPLHRQLEQALAEIYRADDGVVMVSGYGTNCTTIGSLVGPKDLVIYDALAHDSIVAGAKLSSAERRSFPHNDLAALDALLAAQRPAFERVLIVVEGVYSMDGDCPDLPRLLEVKRRHRAWLMIDEAHALGVLGPRGFGLADHSGIDPREVDIWMGTLSKTLAACGGYIVGATPLIDYLKCTAGGFIYSVGMPASIAAAALTSVGLLKSEPEHVQRLRSNGQLFLSLARDKGLDVGTSIGAAVIPLIVGDSLRAVLLSQNLFKRGINVLPIIHPAVPERSARLRFFITAEHTKEQIVEAVSIAAEELARIPTSASIMR